MTSLEQNVIKLCFYIVINGCWYDEGLIYITVMWPRHSCHVLCPEVCVGVRCYKISAEVNMEQIVRLCVSPDYSDNLLSFIVSLPSSFSNCYQDFYCGSDSCDNVGGLGSPPTVPKAKVLVRAIGSVSTMCDVQQRSEIISSVRSDEYKVVKQRSRATAMSLYWS